MSAFGLEIKRLRNAQEPKLTQEKLAELLGVTQGLITNLENGRNTGVSVDTLYRLSDALGVTCDHWRKFLAMSDTAAEPLAAAKKPKGKKK
jgi:transcriptional regulator with XRE-family HTH domain